MFEVSSQPLTLGRIIWMGRRNLGLSQREFAEKLGGQIDYIKLSKIENDRIAEIYLTEWDWLINKLAELFCVDLEWLETIRRQTQVKPR